MLHGKSMLFAERLRSVKMPRTLIGHEIHYCAVQADGDPFSSTYISSANNPDDSVHDLHRYLKNVRKITKYNISVIVPQYMDEDMGDVDPC